MRVFLTGSSGTGKTSVGRILADKLELPHVISVSRNSPYEHGTIDHQKYVQKKLAILANENAVHDRTLMDVYAYNAAYGLDELNPELMHYVSSWVSTEPIVIYFPILFDAVADGVRPTDKDFNEDVDGWISAQLEVFFGGLEGNRRYFEVDDSTPEQRADNIIAYIKEKC